jgi:hypothetical protein
MGRSVLAWRVSGPLAPHVEEFAQWLTERGFSRAAVGHRMRQFGDLSRWLEAEGLRLDELTADRQKRFLGAGALLDAGPGSRQRVCGCRFRFCARRGSRRCRRWR